MEDRSDDDSDEREQEGKPEDRFPCTSDPAGGAHDDEEVKSKNRGRQYDGKVDEGLEERLSPYTLKHEKVGKGCSDDHHDRHDYLQPHAPTFPKCAFNVFVIHGTFSFLIRGTPHVIICNILDLLPLIMVTLCLIKSFNYNEL